MNREPNKKGGGNMPKSRIIVVLTLLFLLCGCSSIQTKPFEDFFKALTRASTSIDSAMNKNYDWEKNNFYDDFMGKKNQLSALRIQRKQAFELTTPDFLFMTIADTRLTLTTINEATIKYANLLVTLSGSELIDPKTFEEMAKDVNNSMNSIFKSLDEKVPGDAIPMFSLAASEIARLVVEHQRRVGLIRVLRSGQPSVERYTAKVISLIGTLEQSLNFSYGKRFDDLSRQFNGLTTKDAKGVLDEALKLNDEYTQTVHGLLETKRIYESIPEAHKELLGQTEKPGGGIQAVSAMSQSAVRLERIYGEMVAHK
jgi:hypothetical protein